VAAQSSVANGDGYLMFAPQAKPEPIKCTKGRQRRTAAKVVQRVRAQCVERDGDCRMRGISWHVCGGESEWAHLGDKKRARTRGMAPEIRHTTAGSLMLCTTAHAAYDAGRIQIEPTSPEGADGILRFIRSDAMN
jgi:hypothetical protein